jgi:hypothetical protein
MIRHCVFVRFRADISQVERSKIYADLAALKAVIPGFLAISFGKNVSPRRPASGF